MSLHFTATRTAGSPILTTITDGAYQAETLTVVGTASGTGNLTVTLTAAGLQGSPIAILVPITSGWTATQIATEIAAQFTANNFASRAFTFIQSANLVTITARVTRANDATLAMVITAGLGITTSLTSGAPAVSGVDGVLLSELTPGDRLSGTGIATDTYIIAVDDAANTVTMSENATDGAPTAGPVNVQLSSVTTGQGTLNGTLTSRGVNVSAHTYGYCTAVLSAGLRSVRLQATTYGRITAAISGTPDGFGLGCLLHGMRMGRSVTNGNCIGALPFLSATRDAGAFTMTGTGSVTRALLGMASASWLTVRDAVLAAVRLLQSGCGCGLPTDSCLQESIIQQINACLQTIYSRADRLNYFSRKTLTLAFAGGDQSKVLDTDIQGVLGPVRISSSKIVLREVTDRAQFDRFTETFYGSSAPSEPRAYYLQSLNIESGDNVQLAIFVTPTPAGAMDILADVIAEAPRYTWRDATDAIPLKLPHKYAESLLIPLIREWATSHEFFADPDLLPAIKQQADIARQTLGMVDTKKPKGPREAAVAA